MHDPIISDDLKALAEGYSLQMRFASRVWLALAMLALVAIASLPIDESNKTGTKSTIKQAAGKETIVPATTQKEAPNGTSSVGKEPDARIPLLTMQLPQQTFYFLSLAVLTVLFVAFCTAQIQANRAGRIFMEYVRAGKAKGEEKVVGDFSLKDVAHKLYSPGLNRVWPLAAVFCGRFLSAFVYVVLKILAVGVYYLLPVGAIWRCRVALADTGPDATLPVPQSILPVLVWCLVVIAGACALITLFLEVNWTWHSINESYNSLSAGAD